MNLRKRTLLTIIAATLIIMAFGIIHGHFIFLHGYEELEINEIENDVKHIRNSLEYELENLSALTNDWAAWDDTYQFVQDKNQKYLDSNLVDDTFTGLGLNLIIYYDINGQIIYQKAFNLAEQEEIPISDETLESFNEYPGYSPEDGNDQISGFLAFDNKLMLFSLCPILTSLGEGPEHGYLLFAKQTQGRLIEHLKGSSDSKLSILPYDETIIPITSTPLSITNYKNDVYVNEINNDNIGYYTIIKDYKSNPIFIIKQEKERLIYQQGLEKMRNQLLVIIFTSIFAGGVLIWMLDKHFLARISTLHNSVVAYRNKTEKNKVICLSGNDELTQLSLEIENTLHSLMTTQSKLNGYLEYENLMVDISTRFINLPVNKIDSSLQNVLDTVCKYLNVDRGLILIFYEEKRSIEHIYEWVNNNISSIKHKFLNFDSNLLQWAFKRFLGGNSIIISDINDLPVTATIEKLTLEKNNIQSVIGIPLTVAGRLIGLIAVQMVNQPRKWENQTPILLEIISNIIANAIDRKRNESQLHNSKHFQYQLNQITKTSIEKENYNSSIRALSQQLCSLISTDQGWLILLEKNKTFQVFNSGKKVQLDKNITELIKFLLKKTIKSSFVYDSTTDIGKWKSPNPNLIGKSFIASPLTAKNQRLGLVILADDSPRHFTNLELSICQQAATQITLAIIKIRALEESQELSKELQDLRIAVVEFSSELDINKLQDTILERAVKLLHAEGGEFYLFDEISDELITVTSHNMNKDYKGTRIKADEGAAGKAVQHKKIFSINDYSTWTNRVPDYEDAKIRASISTPLMVGDRLIGCISVFHYKAANKFSKNDQNLLSIFAQHASIAMDNAILFNKVQEMAHVDEVTGLLNRRALNEIGEYEIKRSIRLNRPVAVAMIDLDNYKQINDTYNHIVGDKALKEVSRLFRENIRNIDILGRYGGDECIIIMPETDIDNAIQTIERVRSKLENSTIKIENNEFQITACFGISAYSGNPPSLETMILEADAAMYAAKNAGRNCIRIFQNL